MTEILPTAPPAETRHVEVEPEPRFGVGERRRRFDALGRVRGTIRYTGDEPVAPGTAFVGIHRSTMPHARIVAVHTEAALEIEGVLAVVTGRDLYEVLGDRIHTGPAFADQPCLAVDKTRFVGEAVAAVLATDLETARSVAHKILVEYEELPPVYDIEDALRGDSFVHEELRPSSVFADLAHLHGVRGTNVNYEYRQVSPPDPCRVRLAGVKTWPWCPLADSVVSLGH